MNANNNGLLPWLCLILTAALSLGMVSLASAQSTSESEMARAAPGVSADRWREVRSGETDANFRDTRADSNYNLVNSSGETWRQWRNRWVSPFGLIAIGGMAAAIALFYLIIGRKELAEPRTGRKLFRWSLMMRSLHWTVASLFIVLALTGLNLLFGKFVFPSLLGDAGWAWMVSSSKTLHNYLGPLFSILLIVMLVSLIKENLFNRHDLEWFKQGGGMFGDKHVDAGFCNGGEKAWYWLLASVGVLVVASGLVLDFPNFNQGRDIMQWANLVHAVGALGLTAVSLGHIYIGTLGTEGALEGMTTGYVDETWAKEHHNLWYEDVKDQAVTEQDLADSGHAVNRPDPSASRPG